MQSTRLERNISLSYSSAVSIKGKTPEKLQRRNSQWIRAIGLPIHNSRHEYGFPVDTFGMSKDSNKYFFIVPKSLCHILQLVILVASNAVKIVS